MKKKDLLRLDILSSRTPNEIKKEAPELFSTLATRTGLTRKAVLEKKLADASAEIKKELSKIDLSSDRLGNRDPKEILKESILKERKSRIDREKSENEKRETESDEKKLEKDNKRPGRGREETESDLKQREEDRRERKSDDKKLEEDKTRFEIDEKQIESELSKVPDLGTFQDFLQPDIPLALNPFFQKDLKKARMYRLGELSGLTSKKLNEFIESRDLNPGQISDEKLSQLVAEKKLTEKEAKKIGLHSDLYLLLDSSFELAEFVSKRVAPESLEELARLGRDEWRKLIEEAAVELPEDLEQDDYAEILYKKVENLFPGRALSVRIDRLRRNTGSDEKSQQLGKQMTLVDTFIKRNQDVDLLAINYIHDSQDLKGLNFQGLKVDEQKVVLDTLKSWQRVYSLAEDLEYTEAIVTAGFHSAYHITSTTLSAFTLATGLTEELAVKLYNKAHESIIHTTGMVGSILDQLTGSFDWTAVSNLDPSIKDYLKEIPGYDELFGHLSFCDCKHCESIYSPAAYFVDLMQFVEKHVIGKHFSGSDEDHVMNLKVRRPDLWTLPLNCENTNTLIPSLDIINGILEAYIAKATGFNGDLADRKALEESVYKQEIALEKPGAWKTGVNSFHQPYHLPADRVSIWLNHFGKSRADMATLLDRPDEDIAKAKLDLTRREFELITEADLTPAFLESLYGISFSVTSGKIAPFDAQSLLQVAGIDRGELGRLIKTRFVSGGTADIVIKGEKRDAESVQNDIERIRDLTFDALDRMHRFVRLWKKTGWTIEELDAVLAAIQSADLASGISAETITMIGRLLELQENLDVPVGELIDICFRTPINGTPESSTADPLPRLADLLELSDLEFSRLFELVPDLPEDGISRPSDLSSVLDFYEWWKSAPFSLEELHFITTREWQHAEADGATETVASGIISQVQENSSLNFADTLFTWFDDITEDQSRAIIAANDGIIESATEEPLYRLKPEFNPAAPLDIPAGIETDEETLREKLTKFHACSLIPFYLSAALGLPRATIETMMSKLGISLTDPSFMKELQGESVPPSALTSLVDKLLPSATLLKGLKQNEEALNFLLNHTELFDLSDLDDIPLSGVQKVTRFTGFIEVTDSDDGTSNLPILEEILNAWSSTAGLQAADQEKLADLLGIDPSLLPSIHQIAGNPSHPVEDLYRVKRLSQLCSQVGVGADVLQKIVSEGYEDLSEAADSLEKAIRNQYSDPEEGEKRLEEYQDRLRGRKRASLTDYLIHSGFPQFRDEEDLFHYFLIDTELEGCARTSKIVAATMSLQLYIHRVLLNLEQDSQVNGTSERVHVKADDIPGDEWEWRKNYRVWEANRKVFLYPENYIEPDLRDNKTPLFEELESELMQQEINADTVLEAYGRYMRGFDEIAHLKIAGSFHEKDEESETDVLHLFGVTSDEPPIYYYRRIENIYYSEKSDSRGIEWGPWEKINVQIPVREVSPILYNGRLHLFWVKVTTLANTVFDQSQSVFTGYSHKFSVEFTTLKLDGSWTPPQKLNLRDSYPFSGNGVVQDPLAEDIERHEFQNQLHSILRSYPFFNFSSLSNQILALKTPRFDVKAHYEPIDEYTLTGYMWDRVYPSVENNRLILTGAGYQMRAAIDFYDLATQNSGTQISNVTSFKDPAEEVITIVNNKPGKILIKDGNRLLRGTSPHLQLFDNYAYGELVVNTTKADPLLKRHWNECTLENSFDDIRDVRIASLQSGTKVKIVNGAYSDAILDVQGDLLYLQGSALDDDGFLLKRLGTTLSETLTRTLFTNGVDAALDIKTQKALREASAPITVTGDAIQDEVVKDRVDFNGSFGTYYREIFFHIPFLLANHLNSQGKYEEAQKWYHYIFNPTASEVINVSGSSMSPEEIKKAELDRNWQYLEFREINTQSLRAQLNDKEAIEAYKKDPFNPHAIARLRLSAYQKSIVMKYVDNLIDWGDQLFARDEMESINEATLLYTVAKEILGRRPAELGDCGEGGKEIRTYGNIGPLLDRGSEFLAELENYTQKIKSNGSTGNGTRYSVNSHRINEKSKRLAGRANLLKATRYQIDASGSDLTLKDQKLIQDYVEKYSPEVTIKMADAAVTGAFAKGVHRGIKWKKKSVDARGKFRLPSFGLSVIRQVSPVFCVPGNQDLLGYYDRVDDRLFKIRNCMNIHGEQRDLSLFAPEIDPKMLVRAKAAGLSLNDILDSISGNLPPYRFSYILERAKEFASAVQNFGSALMSAIEKRDTEELAVLRLTHQQNILEASSRSRKLEIESAREAINVLNSRLESLRYQVNYYDGLALENLNGTERLQQTSKHTATAIHGLELPLGWLAGTMYLIPQLGSPFAMKYGGLELGNSAGEFMKGVGTLATISNSISASAGLEAGFGRRQQGWRHQKKLLEYELKQTERNLLASEIRLDLMLESEKVHEMRIEQGSEVMDFYGDKFSDLGLYTWLSSNLQQLYREAYNNALSIARLAEQAYRFERDGDTFFIHGNYFEASRSGLLAGEKLMLSLQSLEKQYIETNYRKNEIDQAFSLTQIDPAALLRLKQTGSCEFTIPELFFDLFYPGQYRRKIKSVRLTIPSVTGPYTNVSATLSLQGSYLRSVPKLGLDELKEVPASRTTTIAASTAQNDAGVFQLNFRDDRYMPFEGAGAISSWKLSLPKNFRQFDYNTINDAIIHISYTADYDELFREKVEEQNGATEGTLLQILKDNPLSRTFSFRQEFSNDFYRLTEQPENSDLTFIIQNKHFPLFLNGRDLEVSRARLILVTPPDQDVDGVELTINGTTIDGFSRESAFGNLFTRDLGNLFSSGIIKDHTIKVTDGGTLSPDADPPAGNRPAFDTDKLEDMILVVDYRLG